MAESTSSPEVRPGTAWWRALLVCTGLAYIGLPVAELGPKAFRPLIFIVTLSYCATFPLATRELGIIQGERRHGFYTRGQKSHRAIAWSIIALGILGVVLMFATVIVIIVGLRHSDIP